MSTRRRCQCARSAAGTLRQLWILLVLTASLLGYIAYEVNFLYLAYHYLGIWRSGYGGLDNNGAGLMLAMGTSAPFLSVLSSADSVEECGRLLELPVRLREVPVDGSYVESDNRCDLTPALSLGHEQDDSLLDLRQLWNRHSTPLF